MVKMIDSELQDWETRLKLPEIQDSILMADAQNMTSDDSPVLMDINQQSDYPVYRVLTAYGEKADEYTCTGLYAFISIVSLSGHKKRTPNRTTGIKYRNRAGTRQMEPPPGWFYARPSVI